MLPATLFIECPHKEATHKIEVLHWPGPATASAHPVVAVHGLTRNAWDFAPLAERLSATRPVYAFSMAGRGKSDWLDDPALYTYAQYTADCLQVLRQLNLGVVDWVGTSMGGLIGMMLAAMPQTPVARLVLNDVGPLLPLSALQRIGAYVGRVPVFQNFSEALRFCRATYADFGIQGDAPWQFFTEKSLRALPDGKTTLHYDPKIAEVFGSVTKDVDVWNVYDAVKVPTLLLRGERSDILSLETAQGMTQRGPLAKLVTFRNCGHAPALMDAAQMNVVEDFLSAGR
jgi:pimeloyl-ACP methyl ester carboxylesterase